MEASTDIQNILAQLGPGATLEQILAVLMQDFTAGVNTAKETTKTAYQEAIESIQQYYDEAAVGRGQDFQSNFDALGDNVKNLGINFSDSGLGAAYAADQQYITEAADAALSTDLAWFEKMQTVQADLYNSMIIEMAAQMALGKVAEATGGSGGGGGGGGSSSNDSPAFDPDTGVPLGDQDFSITANEDTKYYSPAFDQAVENLYSTGDPVNIQMADDLNAWRNRVGAGGVVEIMQKLQEENDRLDNSRGRTPVGPNTSQIPTNILEQMQGNYDKYPGIDSWYAEEYNRAKAPEDADFNRNLLDWLTPFNPNHGPVVTLEQVNTDGKWKQNTAENQPMPGWGAQEDPGSWVNGKWTQPSRAQEIGQRNAGLNEIFGGQQEVRQGFVPPSDGRPNFAETLFGGRPPVPNSIAAPTRSSLPPLVDEGAYNTSNAPQPGINRRGGADLQEARRNEIGVAKAPLYDVANTLDMLPHQNTTSSNYDDARSKVQASIDAALAAKRQKDWEAAEQRRLQEAASARVSNPVNRVTRSDAPRTATQDNPHPMGTGTFGQPVRTGIPFYVAAPTKPKPKPRTGGSGSVRYM